MFLEGVLQWALEGGRVLRRVLRKGSEKGLSEKALRRRKHAFPESMTPFASVIPNEWVPCEDANFDVFDLCHLDLLKCKFRCVWSSLT